MKQYSFLITDLDNTLYDWVTYFSTSFTAMIEALVPIINIDKEQLRKVAEPLTKSGYGTYLLGLIKDKK